MALAERSGRRSYDGLNEPVKFAPTPARFVSRLALLRSCGGPDQLQESAPLALRQLKRWARFPRGTHPNPTSLPRAIADAHAGPIWCRAHIRSPAPGRFAGIPRSLSAALSLTARTFTPPLIAHQHQGDANTGPTPSWRAVRRETMELGFASVVAQASQPAGEWSIPAPRASSIAGPA